MTIGQRQSDRGPGGQATLSQLRDALDRLHSRAPSDIRPDVATLSKVTGQLQEALLRQDQGDETARDQARTELDAGLATFEESSGRIVDYTKRTCGLDLTGATTSAPGGAPAAPGGSAPTAASDDPTTDGPTTTTP